MSTLQKQIHAAESAVAECRGTVARIESEIEQARARAVAAEADRKAAALSATLEDPAVMTRVRLARQAAAQAGDDLADLADALVGAKRRLQEAEQRLEQAPRGSS